MITNFEVLETIKMFQEQHLDVRTVTMGISLLDCISPSASNACSKIYEKITRYAKNLVRVCDDISREYRIPIINKRISVTPIAIIAAASGETNCSCYAQTMDRAARECGVDFIGGFSALVHKGYTNGDRILIDSIPESLAMTDLVCSSVNLASSRTGINMDAVRQMGNIICDTARMTADKNAIGCAKLVVFANAPEDNPFMAGAFHGVGEAECIINVGISGPGVIKASLESVRGMDLGIVAETIKRSAFKITRVGELVAQVASQRLGVPFGIIDLSLAPTPSVGDSVARILEEIGLEDCGAWGTTAALAMLNDAVKKGGTMASSFVGGLSGAFIPVSEDEGMIDVASRGKISIEKLEAMTCVCSVGLDMIAVPGDTPPEILSGMIADEMAIGTFNNKTTAVRVIPVPGKTVGDSVEYGGLLGKAPIMHVNTSSCKVFIDRGGRIPAPIHSMKN
ncbi:MAG: PFL family protein [Oscillospiraceae bacterium]|nr:PFL family protein [Oscillospiraceae bacterium]